MGSASCPDVLAVFTITPKMLQAWTPAVSALSLLVGAHMEAFHEAHAATTPGRRVKYIRMMHKLERVAGYIRAVAPPHDPAYTLEFFAAHQGQANNHAEAARQLQEGY